MSRTSLEMIKIILINPSPFSLLNHTHAFAPNLLHIFHHFVFENSLVYFPDCKHALSNKEYVCMYVRLVNRSHSLQNTCSEQHSVIYSLMGLVFEK